MPNFIFEPDIPGAVQLSPMDLQGSAQKSCGILRDMRPGIQRLEGYITADKVYCIYIADSEQVIRKHAGQSGFPANRIEEIKSTIAPRPRAIKIQPQ